MQITFKREEFLQPLSMVAGVVERRQTLPILAFVLIEGRESYVTLTGTDLEVEVVAQAQAAIEDSGAFTLPARKLLDICRALPEGIKVRVKKDGDRAMVSAGKSRFSLISLPSTDFPSIDAAQPELTLEMTQQDLKNLLEHTHFCMAQQDVRYYLNGLLLDIGGGRLRAVATDGHRMAVSDHVLSNNVKAEYQAIVPRKAVNEIARLLSDTPAPVKLQFSTNHIRIEMDTLVFTSKLIDGRFPDYTKVIPASQNKHIKLDRTAFKDTLNRAAILSNEKYRGVRFSLSDGAMSITAHNPNQEEAQEEVAIDYSGEVLEIGFNVSYIIDAVSALDTEEIVLGLGDSNSSCTVTAPGSETHRYVVMPMRL